MYSEEQFLSISAMQHYMYCKRRFALVHIEQIWQDNLYTAEGIDLHQRVDSSKRECRGNLLIARTVKLHSYRLGLSGISDVIEFYKEDNGVPLPCREGLWRPFLIEYKRGENKNKIEYHVQLCAQAICLEEMLGANIENGAIFYGISRRRTNVEFDDKLRKCTELTAKKLHELFDAGVTPKAKYEKKCKSCSMLSQCMPSITGIKKNVGMYMANGAKDETIT